MHSRLPKIALAAVAAALALPAVAPASSVTYIDGANVWLASPDGTKKVQLTTNGTAQSSYHLPSADDQGAITAFQGGNSSTKTINVITPDGQRTTNVMPWQITSWTNFGPNQAHVNPTGTTVAYTYYKNHGPYSGYPNGGIEARLAVVPAKSPGSPTSPMIDQGGGWSAPTWIDNKMVVAKSGALHLEMEPLKFTSFLSFNPDPATGEQLLIDRGEVSRAKHRYLVQAHDSKNVTGLFLAAHTGAFPGGEVPTGCWVPIAPGLNNHWGLSPDGTQVTWGDDQGVKVGTFDPASKDARGVCTGAVTTISATGDEPSFGSWTFPAPEPPRQDPPPPVQQPTPPVPVVTPKPVTTTKAATTRTVTADGTPAAEVTGAPVLDLSVPAAVKTASLRGGLRVAANAPGAGALAVKLSASGKTLGTARTTVGKAGSVSLKLKLTKNGRKAVKRLKGKKATLTVTFTPKTGGARLTSSAKVTLG